MTVLPEDGTAAIPTLDGPIEVVPLVHPANGSARDLTFVEARDRFAELNFAKEREDPVKDAAIITGRDGNVTVIVPPDGS